MSIFFHRKEVQILILTCFLVLRVNKKEAFEFVNMRYTDSISILLISLTCLIYIILRVLVKSVNILILYFILVMAFSRLYFLQFYIFFELSLIPIFIIIFGEGKSFERIEAGVYLFIYTLFFSIPLLICFGVSLNLTFLNSRHLGASIFYLFLFSAFLVKLPVFFLHSWLPKAHVEAPSYGSILLARIILKLGGYGYLKIMIVGFKVLKVISTHLFILFTVGALISSLMCLYNSDLKIIVALSSVSHISLMIGGLNMGLFESKIRGLAVILAHGFSSSLLFFWLNVAYERSLRRRIFICKHASFCINFRFMIFTAGAINIAAPPFHRFFREVITFLCLVSLSTYRRGIVIFFYIIFRTLYSVYLYYNFKRTGYNFFRSPPCNVREIIVFCFHVWFTLTFLVTIMKV